MKYRVKSFEELRRECTEVDAEGDLYFKNVNDYFLTAMRIFCNMIVEFPEPYSVLHSTHLINRTGLRHKIHIVWCEPVVESIATELVDLVEECKDKDKNKNIEIEGLKGAGAPVQSVVKSMIESQNQSQEVPSDLKLSAERHFFLYSKGHYKITDAVEDLRVVLSYYCGVERQFIKIGDVFKKMLALAAPYVARELNGCSFEDFAMGCIPEKTWQIGYKHNKTVQLYDESREQYKNVEYDYMTAVIYKCRSILSLQKVVSIREIHGELGLPDYAILPERE